MTESNTNFGFTKKELNEFEYNFSVGHLEQIPKKALAILGDYLVQLVEESIKITDDMRVNRSIDSLTHSLCHIYEDGRMANELARPIGDILLDKLIEKAEQGYFSHANRAIAGYWKSVQNNPDAWQGLKAVLEKHPHYVFGQKYLGYMQGKTPETAEVLAQRYLETPDMRFVTTTMVDIDGTLVQNGKANELLIRTLITLEDWIGGFAIYTGGHPVSQKKVLATAIAETLLDKFRLLKKDFTVDAIVGMYSQDNDQNRAMRDKLSKTIYRNILALLIAKFDIQTEQAWNEFLNDYNNQAMIGEMRTQATNILEFLNRLMSTGDKQIKIYPKQAFTQDNICLGGAVIDDTQPDAQGIKSLTEAVLNPMESPFWRTDTVYNSGKNLDVVPPERKVTAEQVFAMYQQKHKEAVVDDLVTGKMNAAEKMASSFQALRENFDNILTANKNVNHQ